MQSDLKKTIPNFLLKCNLQKKIFSFFLKQLSDKVCPDKELYLESNINIELYYFMYKSWLNVCTLFFGQWLYQSIKFIELQLLKDVLGSSFREIHFSRICRNFILFKGFCLFSVYLFLHLDIEI